MKDYSWIPALITALGSLVALWLSSRKDQEQKKEDTEKFLRRELGERNRTIKAQQVEIDKLRDKINNLKIETTELQMELIKIKGSKE